jgi:uncharacterized membrane protein YfcA
MTAAFSTTLVALGCLGAFLSGLVGVGGAIIMVPLLYYVPPLLGVGVLDIREVTGITMAQVLVASASAVMVHLRSGAVHRALALAGGGAMAIGAFSGAITSRYVSGQTLLLVFALMATTALPMMFLPVPASGRGAPTVEVAFNRPLAISMAGGVGVMAGLVGAGGAFLLVPLFIVVLGIPVRTSIGTSLAVVAVASVAGFVGKAGTAQIPVWPAVFVLTGSVVGAQLGARLSGRIDTRSLRMVLAALIALSAARVWINLLYG